MRTYRGYILIFAPLITIGEAIRGPPPAVCTPLKFNSCEPLTAGPLGKVDSELAIPLLGVRREKRWEGCIWRTGSHDGRICG